MWAINDRRGQRSCRTDADALRGIDDLRASCALTWRWTLGSQVSACPASIGRLPQCRPVSARAGDPADTTGTGLSPEKRRAVVQVRQPSSAGVLGMSCCLPAGGTSAAWTEEVAFASATDPVLTIVVSTGGHLKTVERFAVTGARPGRAPQHSPGGDALGADRPRRLSGFRPPCGAAAMCGADPTGANSARPMAMRRPASTRPSTGAVAQAPRKECSAPDGSSLPAEFTTILSDHGLFCQRCRFSYR